MPTKTYLAFDLGAESGRAVVGQLEAGRLTLTELHRFANTPVRMAGHLHWNLLGLWENLKVGLRNAASAAGAGQTLHGLGVDTWGVDFGLIDRSGDLLGLPVCYRDSRTDGVMEQAFNRVAREDIFQATGIQLMPFNTLFQLIAMRQSGSPMLDVAERLLMMPDLLHYLFCGQAKTEFTNATTTQMYDPRKKDWAWDLLRAFDLPVHILAPVVPAGTVLGSLSREVATECGIADIPVITPASHDTGSAVASVPGEGDDWCYISSGTWSLMGVEIPDPVVTEKSLRYNYTNEGGVNGSTRFLKNIMGLWLVQECRRYWIKDGSEHSYSELTQMADQARPFVALIDPDHAPFLAPGDMVIKIAQFCAKTGQAAPVSKGELVRSCLESLALAYRWTLEGLEDILGRPIRTIHVVGGGCQNELLNQMTADACNRPVVAGPVEATAIGNILCQAMATGEVKSLAQARSIVRSSFAVKRYEPRSRAQWDEAYGQYRRICRP